MKKVLCIIIVLLICSPAFAQESKWSETDEFLFGTFLLFQFVDCLQTKHIFDNPEEHKEMTGMINWGVEQSGKIFIPIYFTALTSSCYFISDFLKPPNRTGALFLFNLGAFGAMGGNFSRGAEISLFMTLIY